MDIEEEIQVGGIQIVTAYLKQDFPGEEDLINSSYVTEKLQSSSYMICASPVEGDCGVENAVNSDFLIDINGDGEFGYIDTGTLSESVIEETEIRPVDYVFNYKINEGSSLSDYQYGMEFTTEDSYGVAGYYAPILPLTEVQTLNANSGYSIEVTLFTDKTFKFIDGSQDENIEGVCVQKLSKKHACEVDADEGSPGVFHPYFDRFFYIAKPSTEVDFK